MVRSTTLPRPGEAKRAKRHSASAVMLLLYKQPIVSHRPRFGRNLTVSMMKGVTHADQ